MVFELQLIVDYIYFYKCDTQYIYIYLYMYLYILLSPVTPGKTNATDTWGRSSRVYIHIHVHESIRSVRRPDRE